MCLRSFCVTCVQLLFISKCVCVPVFPGLAEGEESAQVHGGQRCHALQPSDLHRGQLVDRTALAERCYFFPCLLQRLPVISFFLPFSAHPFLSMSLCLLCYFLFFFPIQRSNRSQAVDLKLSGALTVAQTESVCVLFLVCVDCGGRFLDLLSCMCFFMCIFFSFFHLCL